MENYKVLLIQNNIDQPDLLDNTLHFVKDIKLNITKISKYKEATNHLSISDIDIIFFHFDKKSAKSIDSLVNINKQNPYIPIIVWCNDSIPVELKKKITPISTDFLLQDEINPNLIYRIIISSIKLKNTEKKLANYEQNPDNIESPSMNEKNLINSLMNLVPDSIYFKDLNSKFIRINKALAKRFGLNSPGDAIGKSDFDYFSYEHASQTLSDEKKIIKTGEKIIIEEKKIWPDSSITWALTVKMPLLDAKNNIIGTFGISKDITERRFAEKIIRDSKNKYLELSKSLAIEQSLLNSLINSMPDIIFYKNKTGNYIGCNKAFENFLGLNKTDLIDTDGLNILPSSINHLLKKNDTYVLEKGRLRRYSGWATRKGKNKTHFDIIKAPYYNENSEIIGLIGICRDNTEIQKADEIVKKINVELENRVNARTHELEIANKALIVNEKKAHLLKVITSSINEIKNEYDAYQVTLDRISKFIDCHIAHAFIPLHYGKKSYKSTRFWYVSDKKKYLSYKEILNKLEYRNEKGFANFVLKQKKPVYIEYDEIIKNNEIREELADKIGVHVALGFPVAISKEIHIVFEFFSLKKQINFSYLYDIANEASTHIANAINRKRAEQGLTESQLKYKKLSDFLPQAIFELNLNGKFTYLNKFGYSITGYSTQDLNKGLSVFDIISKEEHNKLRKNISLRFAKDRMPNEYNLITKSNTEIPVIIYSAPIHKNNRPVGLRGIIIDISIQKEAEKDIKMAKEEAELANRAKNEFLTNISHEIRTPLNAIIGFASLLSNKIENNTHLSYLSSIKSSGTSLLSIINDILDISKIESGLFELNYTYVNLGEFINNILQLFKLKAAEKRLDLSLNITNDLPSTIFIDEGRLRQVIINIIGNAIKFTNEGFIHLNLSSTNSNNVNKQNITIEIEDSGVGIPKKYLSEIFNSFTQYKNVKIKNPGGTGLGLAISKKLITMMNGDIIAESELNKGTKFTIELYDVEASNTVQKILLDDNNDNEKYIFNKSKVIIADDSETNLILLADALNETGLEIIKAYDGKEALKLAKEKKPGIIITDLLMPKLDGFELLKKIKKDENLNYIKVIAISALATKEIKEKVSNHEFENFFVKPFQIKELFKELSKHIKFNIIKKVEQLNDIEDSNESQISNLPELLEILNNKHLIQWDFFKINQPINDVKKFSLDIIETAVKYKISSLQKYGENLLNSLENFEIDKMLGILNDFPNIVKKYNSMYIN